MPGRNSSQPGKDSGQPGEGLQTASKKLPPARKTLDGTHTSQLTSSQAHSSHRLTPHTLHCPKFTDPPHTAPYLTSHTSHLTMTASLKELSPTRQDSNQPGRDFNQPGRDSSQPGRTKKLQQTVQNASLPQKLMDGARMLAVRPSFG